MPDRRAQILALLATRHDHLPEPTRRTGIAAGFVHRTLAPAVCGDCDGVDPHCRTCRGTGTVEVWRTRDPYATDRVTPYGLEQTVKLGHVAARDAELGRLEQQTAAPVATELDAIAEADRHPYGWELARQTMYARFDYHALDLVLERLAEMCVPVYSPIGRYLLDRWLPDPLRAPVVDRPVINANARGPHADTKARGQRDDQVRDLLAAGRSYAEVAAIVGLTVRQLRRIASVDQDEVAA